MTMSMLPPPMSIPPAAGVMPPGLPANAAATFGRTPTGPLLKRGVNYDDDQKLLALAKKLKEEYSDNRTILERAWWRILLYVLGRQWIYLDTSRGWVDKRMAKWIPRPVTNKIGETLSSYRSVFQSVVLAAKARPNGNDPKNVTTAETADRLESAIRNEHKMESVIRESDFWFITLGNVFWHPWWDKRAANGAALIPFERCSACAAASAPDEILGAGNLCPKCGQPSEWTPAIGEDGEPEGLVAAPGRGRTDVCSPFEIMLPQGYTEFQDIEGLIRARWRTKAYVEALDPELAKKLTFDTVPIDRSLQLLRALATTADAVPNTAQYGVGQSGPQTGEGITEYELHLKPNRDYEDGLLLRWMGESSPQIVRSPDQSLPGPLPYHDVKGNPLFNWLHAGYEHMGGRIWARSPLEPGLSKQDQINQIDSLIQMIIQRTANPVWLEPKGSEVKKFTGEPGLVVKYNASIAGGGAKPERIPGENIPPSLPNLRQSYITDFENLMGTSDVLKGQRPPNVEAFSALQLLVERSQSRFATALAERGHLYRDWFGLALELEREFGPEARTFAVLGSNQAWTMQQYKKADLTGEIDIIIEDGSQTPKTSLGKRASVEQLNQLGLIDATDAEQKYTILKIFGQTDLLPSLDNDVKSALQEQDDFERWASDEMASQGIPLPPPMPMAPPPEAPPPAEGAPGEEPPAGAAPPAPVGPQMPALTSVMQYATPVPLKTQYWHNDAVHNAEHRKWANADNCRRLFMDRPDLAIEVSIHMQRHDFAVMLKEMQKQQMASGLMPPPPAQGAGQALERSNSESGNPGDVPRGQSEAVQGRGPE